MLETPVLFLVFNRPDVTQRVFERIREVQPKQLFVAADGPRLDRANEFERCKEVRKIATSVDWNCEVKTLFRTENLGCGKAVSDAITWFFDQVEEGIILEDDCLPDLSFFRFCRELLSYYRDNKQVMMISGDNFQEGRERGKASYYFSKYAHVWGWATWRSSWESYNHSMKDLEIYLTSDRFSKATNLLEREYWSSTFNQVKAGKIDSWAYRWQYSLWLSNGISVVPNRNLVCNIGFNRRATHTIQTDSPLANMKTLSMEKISYANYVSVNKKADKTTFKKVFCQRRTGIQAIKRYVSLSKLLLKSKLHFDLSK